MPATERKPFVDELVVVTDLNISDISRPLPKDVTSRRADPENPALESRKRFLRFCACIYAATMIVVLVVVHSRDDRHVGIKQFFLACTAGFYIIFYQVLSAKDRMRQWFKRNGSTFRAASIALAALVVSIPIALLFIAQAPPRSTPSLPSRVAETAVTQSLADAANKSVREPIATPAEKPLPTAVIGGIRYTSDSAITVVIVDLDRETQFEVHRISSPERIYVDLQNTKLSPVLFGKEIRPQDRLLRAIRVGEHEPQTSRVTMATTQICDYSVSWVPNSTQLRIELRMAQGQVQAP